MHNARLHKPPTSEVRREPNDEAVGRSGGKVLLGVFRMDTDQLSLFEPERLYRASGPLDCEVRHLGTRVCAHTDGKES